MKKKYWTEFNGVFIYEVRKTLVLKKFSKFYFTEQRVFRT